MKHRRHIRRGSLALALFALACSNSRDEAWPVRVGTVSSRSTGEHMPESEVRRALDKHWSVTPLFRPAKASERESEVLDAEVRYWEVMDDSGARQLVVSLEVPTPAELRAATKTSSSSIEATVLLERDGNAPIEQDLDIALARAVAVIDARTRLVVGTSDQLRLLLNGDDAELAALALEWIRDRGEPDHLDDVLRLLDHQDARVFEAAVEALGVVGGPEHVPALLGRVRLDNGRQAHRAYEALADLGGPEAVEFLRFAAANEDEPARREAARTALRAVDGHDSVEAPRPGALGHRR